MRKTISILIALALVFGALMAPAAEAGKKKKKKKRIERVVEFDYTLGGLGLSLPDNPVLGGGGVCRLETEALANGEIVCHEIPTKVKELYVKVEVNDATGMGPGGFISQGDVDGDGVSDGYGTFCGAHEEPVEMTNPGAPLRISYYYGTCADGTPSFPTQGTVTVTFSNLP